MDALQFKTDGIDSLDATLLAFTPRRGLSRRALARVLAHVEQHLTDPITASALADVACMSRFHFARLFRISVGESPMRYVQRRRIDRAQQMLLGERVTMAEVAAELCFFDQSHFSRTFKRVTGVCPRDFVHRSIDSPLQVEGGARGSLSHPLRPRWASPPAHGSYG